MAKTSISPKALLAKCKGKSILLLCHENADLDAVCSAAMFGEFLKKNKISSVIGIPQHINDRAQHFCFNEHLSFQLNPALKEFDLVILFDVNGPEQLGRLRNSFEELKRCSCFELMVFDHHVLEKDSIVTGKNAFIDEDCVSTTQLLSNLLDGANLGFARPAKTSFRADKYLSKHMHFLNCLGIIEDTGHFMTGDVASFESFASSLKLSGKSFADVLEYAKHPVPSDERMAFLKAAQRANIQQLNGAIVVTSTVSFYQGAAASKLLSFGADVVFVAGQEKNGLTTLSGRASTEFKEKHKFNLMKNILVPLQSKFGGDAGGHSGAAQWKGKAEPNKVLQGAVELLRKFF